MSSPIWKRCAANSKPTSARAWLWRVVPAKRQASTRQLVDSAQEHAILEALLDQVQPPAGAETLHPLLWKSFRRPPLLGGSRFGRPTERGIWYGAEHEEVAFAEVAFHRVRFFAETHAELGVVQVDLFSFQAALDSEAAVDVTAPPFDEFTEQISDPSTYAHSQPLGTDLRAAGFDALRYRSARLDGGRCWALFLPSAFGPEPPRPGRQWSAAVSRDGVEVTSTDPTTDVEGWVFSRQRFEIDGALPNP